MTSALIVKEQVLKGGSLNKTAILTFADGSKVVRKSIDRRTNREYGFVRWYSQMKRLQRYEQMFPGLFPKVIDVGSEGDAAYFDMPFFDDAVDLKKFLVEENPTAEEIKAMHKALWVAMDRMHSVTLPTPRSALGLYFQEEVAQKLKDAMAHEAFSSFAEQSTIIHCGEDVPSLLSTMDVLQDAFCSAEVSSECFTHGNVTLENVMYRKDQKEIIFIDPYDENIVDCIENEYSQVLQSCHSKYGLINDREVTVDGNKTDYFGPYPEALDSFNDLFHAEMKKRLSPAVLRLVRLFEVSQFVRMLPFKVAAGDLDKAKFFYGHASKLQNDLKKEGLLCP